MGASKDDAAATRRRLIEAAMQLLQRQGAANLTLDAVAKEAGVSKGGLLHHFPSKQALSEAMLLLLFAEFEERVEYFLEREPATAGRLLRAYVRATFAEEPEHSPLPLEVGVALLSAMAEQTALRVIILKDSTEWQRRLLDDGLPAARAMVVRQAADAYWTERLFGVATEPVLRDALVAELLELATPPVPSAEC